jgi:uncharacterized protein (DUF3084 family)
MGEVDLEKVEGRRARAAAWMNNQDPPEGAGERAAWLVITGDVPALIAELEQIRRDMADLRVERDQYWSRFNSSQDSNKTLAAMAREERDRANEAARLSAEARDQADDLRTEIGELGEQIEILEQDRTSRDAWAVNLCTELGLYSHPYEVAHEFEAIAARLRECVRGDRRAVDGG